MTTCFARMLGVIWLLAGLGCASAPEIPDWVMGTSSTYQDSRYLIGRGQGSTPALARDRARADLAKNFRVAVSAESRDLLAYRSKGGGGGAEDGSELESEVSRQIVTRTDQVVEGVKILEQWQDPESHQSHALAVLDRLQAGNQLRRLISDLDRETDAQLARARAAESLLMKIGAATAALAAQVERRHYQQYLSVVDRTGVGSPPPHDPVRLKTDLDALLGRVSIHTRVAVDPLGGLDEALAGAVAASGFVDTAAEADAAYLLEVATRVEELAGSNGWYWVRGRLDLSLRDGTGAQVVGTHSWPLKVSSQQPEEARMRASFQIAEILARELRGVVIGFGEPRN